MTAPTDLSTLPVIRLLQERGGAGAGDLEPLERASCRTSRRPRGSPAPRRRRSATSTAPPSRSGWGCRGRPAGRRWPRTTAGAPSRTPPGRRRRAPAAGRGTGWSAAGAGPPSAGAGAGCRRPRRSSGSRGPGRTRGASWCGSKRLRSHSCRSKLEQWPSTSHSAIGPADAGGVGDPDRLGDPEPGRPGTRPSSGMSSVVNEKIPLMPSSIFASRVAGSSACVCRPGRPRSPPG